MLLEMSMLKHDYAQARIEIRDFEVHIQYDKENVLTAVEGKTVTIEGNTLNDTVYGISVEKNASTEYCRAYIWDDFTGLYPLHKFIEG